MSAFFHGVIRLRWLIIALVLGVSVLAWGQLRSHLRFESDLDAMVPADNPVSMYKEQVEERFGMRDNIVVGVLNDNPDENGVFNPRSLAIVKELSEQIALLPGIKAVRDEDVSSVATMDNITGTADGMAVNPFMETVPDTPEALAALRESLFHNEMYVDWLVSRDGTGLLIMAKLESAVDNAAGLAQRAEAYNAIEAMVQAQRDAGVPEQLYVAGRGAMEITVGRYGRQDMATFLPLVLGVVLVTLYLTYRSLRGVLLPFAVVVGSVIWTLGLMGSLGFPLYFISTMMPVVLMAIGVADGIHILSRYYDEILEHPATDGPTAVVATMSEMWLPVMLTSLTTAAGFLSFLTAPLPPQRDFGLFAAVGVLVAMVLSLTLLPAVLAMLPVKVSRGLARQMSRSGDLAAAGWAARGLSWLGRSVARRPLLVWVPSVVVVLLCLVGTQRIVVDASAIRIFPDSSSIRVAEGVLRQKFQGTVPLYVVIEGHEADRLKDPVLLQQLDRMQAAAEQDPIVGGSVSIAEFVKRMNRVMNEDRPEMEVIPTNRDLVAQYLLLYSFSGDPDDFDEVVDYDYQYANVALYLREDSSQEIGRVVRQVQDYALAEFGRAEGDGDAAAEPLALRVGRRLFDLAPTSTGWETDQGFRIGFAGGAYFTYHLSELVISGQVSSLLVSLGAVFVLTAFMFRSVVAGLVNVIPIGIVIIFSFGVMGLLGLELEVGRALTSSMVIGIGIDYTIHFLNKYRLKVRSGLRQPTAITEATMATSGKAIFFNAVVVIGGFAVFLSSNFRPNFSLGAMLMLNMGACLLVSMTVLPTLLNTFKPRFVYGRQGASRS